MSGILDLLNSSIGEQMIRGVAEETGQPEDKTADLLSMGMPVLLGAMKKNVAASPEGAQGLIDLLDSGDAGSILDDLGGFFGGGVDQSVKDQGAGLLGNLLGERQPQVENALSQRSGLDTAAIANILKIGAPILLGFLARQRAQANVSDAGGLNSMLGGMLSGQSGHNQDLITSLIDTDGDGSVLDDIADMMSGTGGKKGGLGGLLGNLMGS